jgi:hypothetical protein
LVPLPPISYEVVFDIGTDKLSFPSYTGRYEIGDRVGLDHQVCSLPAGVLEGVVRRQKRPAGRV